MNSESAETVLLDVDSRGVAVVTLNRPEKHNAFDDQLIALLQEKLNEVANNTQVRVLVLAANGKSFSAGADLNWMKSAASYSFEENAEDAKKLAMLLHSLNTLEIPTIAKVQGAAFGGALGLLSCCDIVVASPAAKFVLSEVKIGLIPGVISPYVISAIGARQARRYFLSAERFDANKALAMGLVSEVVDADVLNEEVERFIQQLLLNSPAGMTEAKKLVAHVNDSILDEVLINTTSEWIARVRVSEEGQEGLRAFLEKRTPSWLNSESMDNE